MNNSTENENLFADNNYEEKNTYSMNNTVAKMKTELNRK